MLHEVHVAQVLTHSLLRQRRRSTDEIIQWYRSALYTSQLPEAISESYCGDIR